MVALFVAGVFVNGVDNLFFNSEDLVSPIAVTILSTMMGVGVLFILWDYVIPISRRRLAVDTIYLTLIMFLSLFYTAFTPFYQLDSQNQLDRIAVFVLLCFVCISVSIGIAIVSQSAEHMQIFTVLPIVATVLILISTTKLVWIELNNQDYSYFSYYDIGFHMAFMSFMIFPHLKRPKINIEQVKPLVGLS